MKKILLIFLVFFISKTINAQVVMNIQMPQAGMHLNSQLWNLTLINAGNSTAEVRIDMLLSDAISGEPILSGSSREFFLPTGPKQIQLTELNPIQYNIISAQYGASASPDGFIPIGHFVVCFSIFRRNGEVLEKIAEECETLIVEPASPPILVYPEDEASIDENRPAFFWIPPSPSFLFSSLSYQFLLVEVLPNQQPGDAIQNNLPLVDQDNISQQFLQYPATQPALDTGKIYAWMVKAYNNLQPVSNSEIFSFRLLTEKDSLSLVNQVYTILKSPDDMKFTVSTNKIYYEFVNMDNTDTLQLEILDVTSSQTKKINLSQAFTLVRPGQNFLEMDLENIPGIINNHLYVLNATARNGRRLAFKFIYKTTE
jgi:hypothetical protein